MPGSMIDTMRIALLLVASLLVAGDRVFGEETPDLDDPKVREEILKEAVLAENLEERGPDGEKLGFQAGSQSPYTGWVRRFHQNGRLVSLCHYKDGMRNGPWACWDDAGAKIMKLRFSQELQDDSTKAMQPLAHHLGLSVKKLLPDHM